MSAPSEPSLESPLVWGPFFRLGRTRIGNLPIVSEKNPWLGKNMTLSLQQSLPKDPRVEALPIRQDLQWEIQKYLRHPAAELLAGNWECVCKGMMSKTGYYENWRWQHISEWEKHLELKYYGNKHRTFTRRRCPGDDQGEIWDGEQRPGDKLCVDLACPMCSQRRAAYDAIIGPQW